MTDSLPVLLESSQLAGIPEIDAREQGLLVQAGQFYHAGFPGHSLINIWNAAIHNLRRRIESYGVDLFSSAVKGEAGRRTLDPNGDTIAERWAGVDDFVLIAGASRLSVLSKKAGKTLETINWMRNHASPAHESDTSVSESEVVAFMLLLRGNLFLQQMPDAGHSPQGLFEPIKESILAETRCQVLKDQIGSFNNADLRVTFGFMLDLLCAGEEPALANVRSLFPTAWDRVGEDLRKSAGSRYHSYLTSPDADESNDKGAKVRLLEFLISVDGVKYIPDGARATIYRHATTQLAFAKDTSYGWTGEVAAAQVLAQFGPYVPSIAFHEVYQEILAVYCGNYWGRSAANVTLAIFIDSLDTPQLLEVGHLFLTNVRVREELFNVRPKARAVERLSQIQSRLTIQAHVQ